MDMFAVIYRQPDGKSQTFISKSGECSIGSGRKNDIVLRSKLVAKTHAFIGIAGGSIQIDDMGSMTGTWVNKERVVSYGPIDPVDDIRIGDCSLKIVLPKSGSDREVVAPVVSQSAPKAAPVPARTGESGSRPVLSQEQRHQIDEVLKWQQFLHDKIIEQMDLRRKDVHTMSDQQLRVETEALLTEIMGRHGKDIPESIDRDALYTDVLNEAVGLGPLEKLLSDDSVTEIMVNRSDEIFVERSGKLQLSDCTFTNDQAVIQVIERIITPLGRRIDESSPLVDARLKDGSRVNAIIPPLAIKGPCITIRKFAKERLEFKNLIEFGSISPEMVDFLNICVERKRNIVVSGGTGSGKTTLLNVLSNLIPKDERIVTCEDAAELQLNQPNLVSLESRPSNLEGKGEISIRDLVRNALRMRPDRIVVGECRGGEALDMLQAMNTGHDGSLTTAHANSPRDILSRLEVMVLMAGMDLPITAIREQLASAVNIIVQQTRYPCGSRKVSHITEVVGMESGTIQLQNIFLFKQHGVDENGRIRGGFEACGFVPTFYEQLKQIGADVDLSIFRKPGEED